MSEQHMKASADEQVARAELPESKRTTDIAFELAFDSFGCGWSMSRCML
jgi:hypothetical protein